MSRRIKTNYPGVFYRETDRVGGKGIEKVYYIVFKKDGKIYEEKVGRQYADDMTPSRAAGIRAERIEGKRLSRKEVRQQKETLEKAQKNKWTIGRIWEEYLKCAPQLKGLRTYKSLYRLYVGPTFGDREPASIAPLDVDRMRIKLLKTKSPQTVQHVLELLRRLVNFGAQRHLCKALDFKITMPKVDNVKTEDLTPEELFRLLAAIDEDPNIQAGNMMKFVLYTGMRRAECFRLKWEHVDFEKGFIDIINPKGGKSQKIPLNGTAMELLSSHPRTRSPYVFPGKNGAERQDIRRGITRIKDRAGLPKDFRPLHGLRHVYASMLASSGKVDMYTLQKLLTHKSPQMTQRYAHLRDDALKAAANLAGVLVGEATSTASTEERRVVHLKDAKR